MFLGHFAAGLAAKKLTPYTSLGTLLLSAQLLDLIWPTLLLLGAERVRLAPGITAVTPLDFVSYPWSHSLAMAIVWALLLSGAYVLIRRYPRGAIVALGLVVSHWVLDFVTHRPDLPLVPLGGPVVGLGLWNSLPATVVVEGLMFALGLYLYKINTEPVDKIGNARVCRLRDHADSHLRRQPVRSPAAGRDGDRLRRPRAVAAGSVGVLVGPPQSRDKTVVVRQPQEDGKIASGADR